MSYGITPSGFVRKPLDVIKEEKSAQMKAAFGEDIDLSEFSVFGLLVDQISANEDDLWQVFENLYYALTIDGAEGIHLDRIAALRGSSRITAKAAFVELSFTGVDGRLIPQGTILQTPSGVRFVITEDVTIASGVATANAQAINVGITGNQPANSITEFVNPMSGVDTVNNPLSSSGGSETESDADFRNRIKSEGLYGGSSVNSIQSKLNSIESVLSAVVYENVDNAPDAEELPAKSIECVIFGGSEAEIADVLLNYKPAGIESYGNKTLTLTDVKGIQRTFKYTEPDPVDLYVIITITKNSDWAIIGSAEDTNKREAVKENIVRVIGGNYNYDGVSKDYKTRGSNSTIYAWELIAAQFGIDQYKTEKVSGIANQTVLLGTSAGPTLSDPVVIGRRHFPRIDRDKIMVNVV